MRALLLGAAVLLAGCGGGFDEPAQPSIASSPTSVVALREAPVAGTDPGAQQPQRKHYISPEAIRLARERRLAEQVPATSEDPLFTLQDERGAPLTMLTLAPQRGKGYPEIRLVLLARRIGQAGPAEPVRASCPADDRCEWSLQDRHTVTLVGADVARLVARGEWVAVTSTRLAFDVPSRVDIVYSQGARVISRRTLQFAPPPELPGRA